MPIQFQVATYDPPTFDLTPGSGHVKLYVKANIEVIQPNGTALSIFYIKLVSIFFIVLLI